MYTYTYVYIQENNKVTRKSLNVIFQYITGISQINYTFMLLYRHSRRMAQDVPFHSNKAVMHLMGYMKRYYNTKSLILQKLNIMGIGDKFNSDSF